MYIHFFFQKKKKKEMQNGIPKGTILYHGTHVMLPHHLPSGKANWFSTDRDQAQMWATHIEQYRRHHKWVPAPIYVYTYEVIQDIPHIANIKDYRDLARLDADYGLDTGISSDVVPMNKLGFKICKNAPYNGWSYMLMQKQIMLCQSVVTPEYMQPVEMQTLHMTPDMLKRYMYQNILREQRDETRDTHIADALKDIEHELDDIQYNEWKAVRGGGSLVGHDKRPYTSRQLEKK